MRNNRLTRIWKAVCIQVVLLTVAGLALSGCNRKAITASLPFESPENFSQAGDMEMPERWWTTFGNESLNSLVDSALNSNLNLISVWQQLIAARAVVDRESSYFFPDIDAVLEGGISRPQPEFVGGENFQLGLTATYEIDLWGRIRHRLQAERYSTEATYADYRTAAISLSAEIVLTWFRLTAAHEQLTLAREQLETNESILDLMNARFGIGQVRAVDILRQRQLLEATRDQLIITETDVEVLQHRLAVLSGQPPRQALTFATDSLPEMPPLPETGIPVELVERRPDVQSAFYRLQAADREVAVAISNLYPRVNISFSTAIRSNDVNDLFQTWARSFAGSLLVPVVYGGRLRAEVRRTKAVKEQSFYEYGQAVLTAFQDVEDALVRERKHTDRIAVQEEQLHLSRQSYEQLRTEYFNGISNYLDVLTELDQHQQLQREMITARLLLLEYRISLYRALAGGFQTDREAG